MAIRFLFLSFLLALFFSGQAMAESHWVILIEPSFMDHKIRQPVPGSERTIFALARVTDGRLMPITRADQEEVNVTFAQIEEEARKAASAVLAHLEPRYERDKHGVIDYAVLESDDPLTASCVLAPEFSEKFADKFGPDLLVAMPNRYQVLVFSRQDTEYERMGEFIIAGYLGSNYPVSREIFTLEQGKLRSLGVYR